MLTMAQQSKAASEGTNADFDILSAMFSEDRPRQLKIAMAQQFEGIHNIERARDVGSVHAIIPAVDLRPRLIDAVERGMERAGAT